MNILEWYYFGGFVVGVFMYIVTFKVMYAEANREKDYLDHIILHIICTGVFGLCVFLHPLVVWCFVMGFITKRIYNDA